jgi:hypothetical protein
MDADDERGAVSEWGLEVTDQRVSLPLQLDVGELAEQIVAAVKDRLTPDILPPAQLLFTVRGW